MVARTRRPLRIAISSGPTRERLDPVRFLSNYSTGYMGAQLAAQSLARGHRVVVVSGPSREPLPKEARVMWVETTAQLARAMERVAKDADVIVMAAAVADFRPMRTSRVKRARQGSLTLKLRATPDVVAGLPRRARQLVVGFALESGRAVVHAWRKLREKRLDAIVVQQLNGHGSPFGRHRVRAWLLVRGEPALALGRCSKAAVARRLLDKIEVLWYGQTMPQPSRRQVDAATS